MIPLLVAGLAIAATYFAIVWAINMRVRNCGFLDVAWSYGLAVLAPVYAWFAPGDPLRKWLFAAVGVAWSARLGPYLLVRVLRHHPTEDARYQTLRARWRGPVRFLVFTNAS